MSQNKSVELSKHETDVLLGLYSGCECLWNTKNPDFRDKKIRVGAIRTIINGMRLETGKDFSTDQMQMALEDICRKYSQELHQVQAAEGAPGNGYKSPWRWFQFLDSFLRDNVQEVQKYIEEESAKPAVVAQQPDIVDDGNDTDDYYCNAADSGDDHYQPPATKSRALLGSPSAPSSSTPPSSRPSRASSRSRVDVNALLNGSSSAETHSSRKRRREAAVTSSSVSHRSSTTAAAAAAASGSSSASYSRQTGSSGSVSAQRRSSRTGGVGVGHAESPQRSSTNESLRISSRIADTLKSVQILLATSLTDQDQPAMVFGRHIANELQQITDYAQRKQCMLEVQQVIVRYQTRPQQQYHCQQLHQQQPPSTEVKFEGRGENVEALSISGASRAGTSATQPQSAEDPLLLYFDTP